MSDDKVYAQYIVDSIANIMELSSSGRGALETNRHYQAAVLYYLHTMAEATQRLSAGAKVARPDVDWIGISGFRNRLVHGYLAVNLDIVWNVVQNYLPDLNSAMKALLETIDQRQTSDPHQSSHDDHVPD